MNRKERRELSKKKITPEELKRIELEAGSSAIAYAIDRYTAAMALTCKDKLGFGKVRTQRFVRQVWEVFDSINKGYLSLDDVMDTVNDELGLNLKK